MKIFKLNALPQTFEASAMYIVASGTSNARIYISNNAGTSVRDVTADVSSSLSRYDLTVTPTTGAMDLANAQVFTVANSTSGVRALSITNAPANRAMTVVVRVVGNTGTVTFPSGAKVADGADTTLGTTATFFVLMVIGTDVTVISNIRVNN